MIDLVYSAHAIEKMRSRGVTPTDVEHVLRDYRLSWTRASGEVVKQLGPLAVVTAVTEEGPIVITVLLNTQDQWSDEDVRRRPRY